MNRVCVHKCICFRVYVLYVLGCINTHELIHKHTHVGMYMHEAFLEIYLRNSKQCPFLGRRGILNRRETYFSLIHVFVLLECLLNGSDTFEQIRN